MRKIPKLTDFAKTSPLTLSKAKQTYDDFYRNVIRCTVQRKRDLEEKII